MPLPGAAGRVLRNRSVVTGNGALTWLMVGATVVIAGVAGYLLLSRGESGRSLGEWLAERPVEALTLFISLVLTPLGLWRALRERVVLEPGAVRFEPGLSPPWSRPWTVQLHDLESASVEVVSWLPLPAAWTLTLHTRSGLPRTLRVFQWVDPDAYEPADHRPLDRGNGSVDEIGELLQRAPLVVFLREAGFGVTAPPLPAPRGSSAATSVAVSVIVILMLGAISYAVLEMAVLTETYAGPLPWAWIGGAGGLAGALTYALLHRDPVGRGGRVVLALLAVLSFTGASFFGLLRLNAVLDGSDPRPHAYVHAPDGRVVPVAADSPELDLPYLLSNFPDSRPGDVHELWLRVGPLGWPQLDLVRFEQSVRAAEVGARER